MRHYLSKILAAGAISIGAGAAHASDAEFLKSLDGAWKGNGTVKVRTSSPAVSVSCSFDSNASATSLSLDGKCIGLVVASRNVAADLKANGGGYTGTYIGSRSGTAALSGSRKGDAINLSIRWARDVNGDRAAKLTVQKVGEDGMRLTTVDVDPETGKNVVTSRIDLTRL